MLTIKVKKNYNIDDAIDFIFHGNQSDLSGHGLDEQKKHEIENAVQNNASDGEPTDAAEFDDDIPLASLAETSNQANSNDPSKY